MRRQVTTYISADILARLREEARDAGVTLSRLIEERLTVSDGDSRGGVSESMLAAAEHRIVKANRNHVEQALRPLGRQLTMLLTMLDQFALSMLTHMPEIPEARREQALASGERRHHGWRLEVEETIQQLEHPPTNGKKAASSADETQSTDSGEAA
ncbi:MAG: hypothetical protein ACREQI_00115 [Candidatus Binataceae bacterium]